ncbi:SDR family oxidoreductase [Sphingomonas limnosediminicola]|uniref:SDR family oxidoreductase n=1 Tax=Sphingomonas limnosediminicola TaxID=940133 RepID=A0ABP7LUG9_9SPHN
MVVGEKQVALVTGASSGIGRATARAFAKAGYTTVLADVHEQEGSDAAAECTREGATCRFIQCDVSNETSVKSLMSEIVSSFGRLDAAFNNAGIEGAQAATAECATDNFDRVVGVNLRGVFFCMREELRQMVKQDGGGAIVNCSSVAGLVGFAGIPAYVASKHGVVGLTRNAALEYAQQKIRVNAVCPGAIETPMLERLMSGGVPRESVVATEPVGRLGTPEEIAAAVLWLCNPAASFVTGQALAVDGGWTAR